MRRSFGLLLALCSLALGACGGSGAASAPDTATGPRRGSGHGDGPGHELGLGARLGLGAGLGHGPGPGHGCRAGRAPGADDAPSRLRGRGRARRGQRRRPLRRHRPRQPALLRADDERGRGRRRSGDHVGHRPRRASGAGGLRGSGAPHPARGLCRGLSRRCAAQRPDELPDLPLLRRGACAGETTKRPSPA